MASSLVVDFIVYAILSISSLGLLVQLCQIDNLTSKIFRIVLAVISIATISNIVLIITEPRIYTQDLPADQVIYMSILLMTLSSTAYTAWHKFQTLVKALA